MLEHELGSVHILARGLVVVTQVEKVLEVGQVDLNVVVVSTGLVVVATDNGSITLVDVVCVDTLRLAKKEVGDSAETARLVRATDRPGKVENVAVEHHSIGVQGKGEVKLDTKDVMDSVDTLEEVGDTVAVEVTVVGK